MADPKKIAQELSPEAAHLITRLTAALGWAYPLVIDCGDYLGRKPAREALADGRAVVSNLSPQTPDPMSPEVLCEVMSAIYAKEGRNR